MVCERTCWRARSRLCSPRCRLVMSGGGAWVQTDVKFFCSMVLRALRVGAKRGSNVACVGEGGCGKSTLLEALENIFDCAAKPEAGSTFPLASAADHDLCLWQDYEHDENTVRFSDLLSFFLGESVGIRIIVL